MRQDNCRGQLLKINDINDFALGFCAALPSRDAQHILDGYGRRHARIALPYKIGKQTAHDLRKLHADRSGHALLGLVWKPVQKAGGLGAEQAVRQVLQPPESVEWQ